MALGALCAVVAGLLIALALCVLAAGVFLGSMVLLVRPWDGSTHRDHRWATGAPFPVFWAASWAIRAAEYVVALKPGTLRAAELATQYVQSQVMFALVNLGIPDMLTSGPRGAADLAAAIGPEVQPERLERLLNAAASFGMLTRIKAPRRRGSGGGGGAAAAGSAAEERPGRAVGVAASAGPADAAAAGRRDQGGDAVLHMPAAGKPLKGAGKPALGCRGDLYSLNGVSAVLTSQSPVCMSSFVKLFEDHYAAYERLSDGLRSGDVPFELWSGGRTFWQHIAASERHAATFDGAMHQVNQIGGTAVASSFPWGRYTQVVDVAGGVGGFVADILRRNPGLRGAVLDQPEQIERAKELWATRHSDLASRVALVAGDMFDAATVPRPAAKGRVAFLLRNILHDWPDADCLAILRAIRARVAPGDVGTGRVQLLVVEVTTADDVLPCHLPFRCASDMTMLMSFGDGKERSKEQFEALFEATGFRLRRITPTSGVFLVLQAEPV